MSANDSIDPVTLAQQIADYEKTALQTEDGGNTGALTSFSYSGHGGYAFGLYQYDPSTNPAAVTALSNLGFTPAQIQQLQQPGTLSQATVNALNTQLQTTLQTPNGQTVMSGLQTSWENNLQQNVQNALDNSSDDIESQILSGPIAIQRLFDICNQFSPTTQNGALANFLSGQTVTGGAGTSATWNPNFSPEANLQNWYATTAFGASAGGTTRTNAFNNVTPTEVLPNTTVDVTMGDGTNPNSDNFTTLNNVTLNVAPGIGVNVSGTSSGNTINLGVGSSANISGTSSTNNTFTCGAAVVTVSGVETASCAASNTFTFNGQDGTSATLTYNQQ